MNPLTITALTTHIAMLFQNDERLRDVWVLGEVSNWKRVASGHIYFRLKDSGATINAVIWKTQAAGLRWQPRDGDQVQAHGYVSVYAEGGNYQLYVNQMEPAGKGQLYAQFEAIKAQLQAEGLFDPARKRPLPPAPRRIGVVTSADAAALRDILRVLSARWPLVEVIVFHTLVQGIDAPRQIVEAIARANAYSAQTAPLDLLILARGGGSIEDLWAFNDRGVAYAIAGSALPVISGVGHEVDFTIADFVARNGSTGCAIVTAAWPRLRRRGSARRSGIWSRLCGACSASIPAAGSTCNCSGWTTASAACSRSSTAGWNAGAPASTRRSCGWRPSTRRTCWRAATASSSTTTAASCAAPPTRSRGRRWSSAPQVARMRW